MKIYLLGQRSILGGGTHFSNYAEIMARYALLNGFIKEVNLLDDAQRQQWISEASKDDVNIFFFGFDQFHYVPGRSIVWSIFESNRLPQNVIQNLKLANCIWVPSDWAKSVLIEHGLQEDMIDVVPEGVNGALYHPHLRKFSSRNDQVFRFLVLGKYEERKGYQQLLQAFQKAFGNNPKVKLLLKADYFINQNQKQQDFQNFIDSFNLQNVKIISGAVAENDLAMLYAYAHAFAFPSRAEGWGLPLIEALASGLPCVTTNYSGHSHFLKSIEGLYGSIDFQLVPIKDPEFMSYWPASDGNYGQWAEASIDDLATKMLEIYSHYEQWQTRAIQASAIIRREFSWTKAVEVSLEALGKRGYLPPITFNTNL
jgi:glycosyltransferase involved in cell wall biosynthesis